MSREVEMMQAEDTLSLAQGLTKLTQVTDDMVVILAKAILELSARMGGTQGPFSFGLTPQTQKAVEALAEVKK